MTPDDKRDDKADAGAGGSDAGASGLEELAGALPSLPPGERAGEDDADLKSLAALAAQRPSAVDEKAPANGGPHKAAAPPKRAGGWVVPLLIGIVIGAAGATVVTGSTAGPDHAEPPAQALAAPVPDPVPVAVAVAAPVAAPAADPVPVPVPDPVPDSVPVPVASSAAPARDRGAAPKPTATPTAVEAEPSPDDDQPLLPVEPPPPPPAGTLPEGSARAMDALLDDALSPAARNQELARKQAAALSPEQLPLTPSREDANKAMTMLLPAIRGCAMGQSGLATANMVVRADGRVAGVEITGAPFAGAASGRCMEGVIRRARFSPFRQATMRIKFPLAIQ